MLVSNDFANLPLWLCKWYLSIVVVLNSFLKHMPKHSKTNSVTLKFKEPSNICSYHLGGRVYTFLTTGHNHKFVDSHNI